MAGFIEGNLMDLQHLAIPVRLKYKKTAYLEEIIQVIQLELGVT